MGWQPRILQGFESIDGATVLTFPLDDYEFESSQGLRTVQSPVIGAHYGFDHMGTRPGVKDFGRESLRCVILESDPGDVDTLVDEFMAEAWSVGLGKLYTIDHDDVRRWAYARLAAMPGLSWRAGMILAKTVQVEFIRMSDWHDETETTSMVERSGNLITNGDFETDTTGWTTGGTNTIAVSTEQAKFGTQSLKCTYQDNGSLGIYAVTLTAAAHSAGAWVKIPTNYDGTSINVQFNGYTSAAGTTVVDADMGIRDAWQFVEVPNVTPDAGDLVGSIRLVGVGAPTAGRSVYLDGARLELGAIASDFQVEGDVPATGTVIINNPGNAPVYDAVLILKGTFTDPTITNTTNGYVLSSTRDGSSAAHWLKFDAGRHTVEWSTNSGVDYANDYSLFVRAATQVGLMKLEPGDNLITFSGATSATLAWSFYGAYH